MSGGECTTAPRSAAGMPMLARESLRRAKIDADEKKKKALTYRSDIG
jgi:hypothetical protein